MEATAAKIENLLRSHFSPVHLQIVDESVFHEGHAGAAAGGGHFQVLLVSGSFRGKSVVERHRAIYETLGELMKQEIHALTLRTLTPEEWEKDRRSKG